MPFDFGSAFERQRDAISHTEGPLLITAGPGTGKTYTLINRIRYLLSEKNADPKSIMIISFTEKAAKELVTRVSNDLGGDMPDVNVNDMYIGTFHHVFLRIIKENLEDTDLVKNFRALDEFDQQYLVYKNYQEFTGIPFFNLLKFGKYKWDTSGGICGFVNTVREELIDVSALERSGDAGLGIAAKVCRKYDEICARNNVLDFSGMQYKAYRLLSEHPEILEKLREQIKYIMVDEYQDTNYIQEQLVLMLAGKDGNLCVVGDDDQSIYRFRGATVSNILNFSKRFSEGACFKVNLNVNKRSAKSIIDFYTKWMKEPVGFSWERNDAGGNVICDRVRKDDLVPIEENNIPDPRVALIREDTVGALNNRLVRLVLDLKEKGAVTDFNQIAFLTRATVRGSVVGGVYVRENIYESLMRAFEDNGIPVFAPRFKMYFDSEEIVILVGFLLSLFKDYSDKVMNGETLYIGADTHLYYRGCIEAFDEAVGRLPDAKKNVLASWVVSERERIKSGVPDYAFVGLIYRMMAFDPLRSLIDTDTSGGVISQRAVRNVALFVQYVSRFETAHKMVSFTEYDMSLEFFSFFLANLKKGNVEEYEDEKEFAPSGCVSFMTIHQSKGLEFPVVIVDAMAMYPPKSGNEIYRKLRSGGYYKRELTENEANTDFYDFYRLNYTAYSRAQNLLVLSDCTLRDGSAEGGYDMFTLLYNSVPDANGIDLSSIPAKEVRPASLKDTYSYTSHVASYKSCPRNYMFTKEFGFPPVQNVAMFFGSLVHGTIEDIHNAAIEGKAGEITGEKIKEWFDNNYSALQKSIVTELGKPQKEAAFSHVRRYYDNNKDKLDKVFAVEEEVNLVLPDYIITGDLDLIRRGEGENDYEIIDLKSENRQKILEDSYVKERYSMQLQIYSRLLKESKGFNITRAALYCTGEKDGNPEIEIDISEEAVDKAFKTFDSTVGEIKSGAAPASPVNPSRCEFCAFRFFCGKKQPERQ